MSIKKKLFMIAVMLLTIFSTIFSFAEEKPETVQVYTWEQNMDIFLSAPMNGETLSGRISKQEAELVESGFLVDKGIAVYTTILIDISSSIPSSAREHVKKYIDTLIQNITAGEKCRMVTFGDEISVLQDFKDDKGALSNAAYSLIFNNQNSRIYDAVYNTIPKTVTEEGKPCYYRTIVITDGVDDTAIGVTKEELYLKLQADVYPIDVVCITKNVETEPNKELSALTRMSSGQYGNLHPQTNLVELAGHYAVGNIFWVRLKLPEEILDGSIRQVNLSDGIHVIEFDKKLPVFEEGKFEAELETVVENASSKTESETEPRTRQKIEPESMGISEPWSSRLPVYVGIGLGAVICLLAVIFVLKKMENREMAKNGEQGQIVAGSSVDLGETEIMGKVSGETPLLGARIRLCTKGTHGQVWELDVMEEILIGRENFCRICLSDSSVSRQQCRIYYARGVMVENLSKSNVTMLNGKRMETPKELKTGDCLTCGREILFVEIFDNTEKPSLEELNRGTRYINL